MEIVIYKIETLLEKTRDYIFISNDSNLRKSINPGKWSKKEILGHLIDSAINNLQRFTEIQFFPQPYKHRSYKQDELVKANNYQEANLSELLELWISLNKRIVGVIKNIKTEDLELEILLENNDIIDLNFLIKDYAIHLEWHVNQILYNELEL